MKKKYLFYKTTNKITFDMKKIALSIATVYIVLVSSCVKERTCQCKNSSSTYDAGTVDKTKSQAKKYCKTLSQGATTCSLKE